MTAFQRRKKVEVVVDAAAAEQVVQAMERDGEQGHTVVPNLGGKGHRGVRGGDDIFGVLENSLVFTIVPEEAAEAIVRDVLELLKSHAGIVYVSDVEVARGEQF